MAKYMLLIYTPVDGPPAGIEQEQMSSWFAYTDGLRNAGVLVDSAPLQGIDTATTLRIRGGETQTTDGPFAETREFLGGYYVLECPDLDTALQHAAGVPNLHYGSTEVRPLMDMAALSAEPAEAQAQA